jgi:hypothetical protein
MGSAAVSGCCGVWQIYPSPLPAESLPQICFAAQPGCRQCRRRVPGAPPTASRPLGGKGQAFARVLAWSGAAGGAPWRGPLPPRPRRRGAPPGPAGHRRRGRARPPRPEARGLLLCRRERLGLPRVPAGAGTRGGGARRGRSRGWVAERLSPTASGAGARDAAAGREARRRALPSARSRSAARAQRGGGAARPTCRPGPCPAPLLAGGRPPGGARRRPPAPPLTRPGRGRGGKGGAVGETRSVAGVVRPLLVAGGESPAVASGGELCSPGQADFDAPALTGQSATRPARRVPRPGSPCRASPTARATPRARAPRGRAGPAL